jgi:hypothetical protein
MISSVRSQQSVVARLSQDDRRVSLAFGQPEVHLRDGALNRGAIGQRERDLALGRMLQCLPDIVRQQGVGCAAVNQETYGGLLARRARHQPFNIRDAHVRHLLSAFGMRLDTS